MDTITNVINFLQSPTAVAIFAALWGVSEALASIPSIQANSIFQLVKSVLAKLGKKDNTVSNG